ncbi:MAG: RDD family protein [Candidatus Thorarchaeota archaeon]
MTSVIKIIAGIFIILIGFPIFIGGSAILLFVPLFTDGEGYFMTTPIAIQSEDFNANFSAIRLDIPLDDVQIGINVDPAKFVKFKIDAHGKMASDKVFFGLCTKSDADSFLGTSIAYLQIQNFEYYGFEFGQDRKDQVYQMEYDIIANTTSWTEPSVESISWFEGGFTGTIFKWDPSYETLTSKETISFILMQEDLGESNSIDVTFSVGANIPILNAIGWVLVVFGGLITLLGVILLWSGLRTPKPRPERVRYYQGAPATRVEAIERPSPKFNLQCSNCGSLNEPDSSFCSQCGEILLSEDRTTVEDVTKKTKVEIFEPTGNKLVVAEGWPRFWAWLIDILITGAIASTFSSILFFATSDWSWWSFGIWSPFQWVFSLGPSSIIFFIYTVAMEHYYGQTLGKMALNLEIVSETTGDRPILQDTIISAIGKAFFLPIDVILGLIVKDKTQVPDLKQRLTQKWARTVVIQSEKKKKVSTQFISSRV